MPHSSHPAFRVRVLRSGSAGNAVLLEAGLTRVLVDAGLPAEAILRDLPDAALTAVLATHEHDDHLRGAAAVARATGAVVLANEATLRAAGPQLAGEPVEVFRTGRPFAAGTVTVTAFPVSHDAAEPVGFVLEWRGARVAVACDLGEVTGPLVEHARGADLLLVEANYDLRLMAVSAYPWFLKNRIVGAQGHLSNDGAARVAVEACRGGTRAVALIHLSEMNNLAPLARDVVRAALDAEGLGGAWVQAVRPNAGGPWWTVPVAGGPASTVPEPASAVR
ncbi:MAG: MBL fold metallo-hydrolase [Armatimonadota bacterium]|nr:MBL fold metallo-hydrolase [Armatimonadota bacterium]